jgi:formylglycine-generating enzyme required for sulfatase activity
MKTIAWMPVLLLIACGTIGCGQGESSIVQPEDIPEGMVFIPAGKFKMGTSDKKLGMPGPNRRAIMGTPDNPRRPTLPKRKVYVDAFFMDIYEVTNEQFCAFLNEKGNQVEGEVKWLRIDAENDYCLIEEREGTFVPKPGFGNHPVVEVTWYGARAYATWAGKRLPTEAEWEKAARGTDGRKYPWGNEKYYIGRWHIGEYRVNSDVKVDGYDGTAPVGSFEKGKSPYGIYDMSGNVFEWCSDFYFEKPNPKNKYPFHAIRGGSCYYDDVFLRSALRSFAISWGSGAGLGFRCAKDFK